MTSTSPRARRRARELVLQGLYQRQLSGNADDAIRLDLLEDAADGADTAYLGELWRGVTGEFDALVDSLAPYASRAVTALSPIERAILAIGAWELAHRADIPYKVVIDEAVELARDFGATDGHRFVNGVLDKLAAKLRDAEIRARAAESRPGG